MDSLVNNRYFPLVQLGLAAAAGAIWFVRPEIGWFPLVIALIPWALRFLAGKFPFPRTPLDLPLLLFLGTAGVGLWAAYDRPTAWAKFWLVVAAVVIYYGLAAQPRENLWLLTAAFGAFSAAVAGYFLLTHDFEALPAKIAILNRIGLAIQGARPSIPAHILHPNVAGGVMAAFAPCLAAVGLRTIRRKQWAYLALVVAGSSLLLLGLLLTTSRGAWLALAIGLGIWAMRGLSGKATEYIDQPRQMIFLVGLIMVASIIVVYAATYPGGPAELINQLPGPANAGSRVDLARNTADLAADYPITGGGLGAFPALYSQYLALSPFFLLIHAHNVYLDVLLEQGVAGLVSFLLIMAGTVALVSMLPRPQRHRNTSLFRWAIIAGVLVQAIHGLVEDPIYGSRALLLLFALPGLGMAAWLAERQPVIVEDQAGRKKRGATLPAPVVAGAMVILLLLAAGLYFRNQLKATWYANLGAIEMGRQELTGWPHDEWDDGQSVNRLAAAESLFQQALATDPNNSTAHYRLGLIAMLRRDYATAAGQLEAAGQGNSNHRGIQKSLGYSYAWQGELDEGVEILAAIPEAREELNVYVWWWGTQGREDLSQQAERMVARLNRQ